MLSSYERISDASDVELTTKAIQKWAVGEKATQKSKAATSKRKVTGPHRPHGVCALEEPDKCAGCAVDFETS